MEALGSRCLPVVHKGQTMAGNTAIVDTVQGISARQTLDKDSAEILVMYRNSKNPKESSNKPPEGYIFFAGYATPAKNGSTKFDLTYYNKMNFVENTKALREYLVGEEMGCPTERVLFP